ncbi:hypothetical protein OKW26_003950 [Paraburkholderia sp. 32]
MTYQHIAFPAAVPRRGTMFAASQADSPCRKPTANFMTDTSIPRDTSDRLNAMRSTLREVFGISRLRPGQRDIIRSVIAGAFPATHRTRRRR